MTTEDHDPNLEKEKKLSYRRDDRHQHELNAKDVEAEGWF